MITADTFFSGTMNTVDAVIGNFVQNAYTQFIQVNSNVITLAFTVYVMFLGYQFLSHSHHFNLHVITKHMIVMLGVYGMVMNWDLYNLFVYNIFTNEPGNIAQILVNSAGKFQSGESIAQALDAIYAAVMNATSNFFGQVNFSTSGIAFLMYGALVFVIGTLLCVFALLLFVYAKMMMAVALALGPIFILFLLWSSTKGLFSAWLNKLITIALIPIVTSAILVLMLSVIDVTLPVLWHCAVFRFKSCNYFNPLSSISHCCLTRWWHHTGELIGWCCDCKFCTIKNRYCCCYTSCR